MVAPGTEIRLGRTRVELLPADVPVPDAPSERSRFGRLVGSSAAMRRLYGQLERVAGSDAPVLLFGEAGVGKNETARAIHEASTRRGGPLVELDLRGGGPDVIDDAFVRAHGGTLILDRIDEATAPLQDALATALDRRERGRFDVRPVALARSDLRERIESGALRRDLWFALAGLRVEVPPLRARLEDLPRLVADQLAVLGYQDAALTAAELATLRAHDFPGNVRELRRMIEETLLHTVRTSRTSAPPEVAVTDELVKLPFKEAKERLLDVFEKHYVEQLLARHGGNVSRAAAEAGVDRNHLARLAKKHGLR